MCGGELEGVDQPHQQCVIGILQMQDVVLGRVQRIENAAAAAHLIGVDALPRRRLAGDRLSESLHRRLKAECAMSGKKMKDVVTQLIQAALDKDGKS